MNPFTTEQMVRDAFGLKKEFPSEVIERSITLAHDEIEKFLNSKLDIWKPDPLITVAETTLAGSKVYVSLGLSYFKKQDELEFGNIDKVELGCTFRGFHENSDNAEMKALIMLEQYIENVKKIKIPNGVQN